MENDAFEARMREGEYYHNLRLLPGVWTVLRLDGRGFSRFTETHFEKPFDIRFHDMMIATTRDLVEELKGIYAYTESDEISLLFPPDWTLFDRELEKLVSVSAGIASSAFSLACGTRAHFDSRVWLGVGISQTIDYFRWRQSDAARCALNGWCYWSLRNVGVSVEEATLTLQGITTAAKNELLFSKGINFNTLPLWQRRGIGIYWETYEKEGFNPLLQEPVTATRRRIKVDEALPMKEEYASFLEQLMAISIANPVTL